MTNQELLEVCLARGIPHHILSDGRVQCVDLSLIAGGLHPLFNPDGTLKKETK